MTAPENSLAKQTRSATKASSAGKDTAPTETDLNKIRDILFGDSVRDLRDVVQDMERAISDRIDALRADLDATRDQLESRIEEVARDVRDESAQSVDALKSEVHTQFETLSERMSDSFDQVQDKGMSKAQLSKLLGDLANRIIERDGDGDEGS